MQSTAGIILLWAGFLSGALATVFSTQEWRSTGLQVSLKTREAPVGLAIGQYTKPPLTYLLIEMVRHGSPASQQGLLKGDMILGINGMDVSSSGGLGGLEGGVAAIIEYERGAVSAGAVRPGAVSTVFLTPLDPWSTINWWWYGGSVFAAVAGIVLVRMGRHAGAARTAQSEASLKLMRVHLQNLVTKTRHLAERHAKMSPAETLHYIDDELADDFREFADGRNNISREFGLEVFAEVMTHFAAGERALNRVWSASADGYVDEAATYIERGLNQLIEARQVLERCFAETATEDL